MLSYDQALAFLEERLPMFSKTGKVAIKNGLENIKSICELLGNPQDKYPIIHIAGTNGKGSTSHLMAAALQRAGYKVGLYTSPHLVDARERIRINGKPIGKDFFAGFVERSMDWASKIQPSYFELTVGMAFQAFQQENVDFAVIETGLGGRLDSTNIVRPILSIITNIDFDHTDILGNTLEAIAREKAGIIKNEIPVVIGETRPETEGLFFATAQQSKSPIYFAETLLDVVRTGQDARHQRLSIVHKGEKAIYKAETDLLGDFQLNNIRTALASCLVLASIGVPLPFETVLNSLKDVKERTGLRGRWEWSRTSPNLIFDVAHNAAGMVYLNENLSSIEGKEASKGNLFILCGFVKDKDVSSALALLPRHAHYYFTRANLPRALPSVELQEKAVAYGLNGEAFESVAQAFTVAFRNLKKEDTLLVTGSFFIVGEALQAMEAIL